VVCWRAGRKKEISFPVPRWSWVLPGNHALARLALAAGFIGVSSSLPRPTELLKVFKGYMGPGSGEFVIASPNKPRPQSLGSYHYRAEQHFAFLIRWLRSKGVASPNPLHTLRKEFGSQIAAQGGIFAASLALRHADIQLTRDYYLDKKQATVFAIGNLLNGGGS